MPNYTEKLNLEKPLSNEQYNINVFNANADKIDTFATNTDININNVNTAKVSKAGDTMTGALTIDVDTQNQLVLVNPYITKGTNPSELKYYGIYFNDSQNLSRADWKDTRLGGIETAVKTDGTVTTIIHATQNVADGTAVGALLSLSISSTGVASSSFPNTTRVDGQWVRLDQTIMNNVNLNGTSILTYTLPLPNDGYDYEVLLSGSAITGTTSGNAIVLQLSSNLVENCIICWTTNRGTSGISARTGGNGIIPVSSSHKIFVSRGNDYTGTASLYMRAYRRIGLNA